MRRSVVAVFVSAVVIAAAGCSSAGDDASDEPDVVETTAGTSSAGTTVADTEPDSTQPPDTDPAVTEPISTGPADSQPGGTAPADSSPTDTEPDPAEVAIAEGALLTLDDMPQGWTESPLDDEDVEVDDVSAELDAAQRQFTDCFGVEPAAEGDPFGIGGARASSGEFADSHDFTISNKVIIADEDGASLVMERYSAESIPACVAPAMDALVEVGFAEDPDLAAFEVGEVIVEQLDLTTWGDATVGYRILVPVTGPDASFDLWMDQIVVQVGRGLSSLQFQSPNSPFEVFEVDSYAMLAAERLTEALG